MPTSDSLQRIYEELANRYARQGEARQRDHCLVLAADAALSAAQIEQAERLRKRLLLTNPHHLLRPFHSMAEAMQSKDIQDYVADLRRQWPPEMAEKLAGQTYAMAEAPASAAAPADAGLWAETPSLPKAAAKAKPAAMTLGAADVPTPPATGISSWLALLVFVCGLAVASSWLLFTFAGPWLE